MNWVKVLPESSLSEGGKQTVRAGQHTLLLVKKDGEIFAVNNTCPHMRLPLKPGKLTDDGGIICPWHRSAFDLRTGDVMAWSPWPPGIGPLVGKLSRQKTLPVFATRVEDGHIFVDLG